MYDQNKNSVKHNNGNEAVRRLSPIKMLTPERGGTLGDIEISHFSLSEARLIIL